MNLTTTRSLFRNPLQAISRSSVRSGTVYGAIIILAMVAFEAFNYGTTAYALRDLLGDLRFAGIPWATLMALAFCGLDFAGIARLITQNDRQESPKESWYLFGAWLIAATFNAALTWWGVSIAITGHALKSAAVVNIQTLTTVVPVLVAIMVWVIRILIIGSLSSALERINHSRRPPSSNRQSSTPLNSFPVHGEHPSSSYTRPVPSNRPSNSVAAQARVEPTYHKFSSTSTSTTRPVETMGQNERQARNL
ncbi:MAG: hypothetical protein FD147_1666 [Chloroflexi bacterium]|nr:MAG: hypothetical protein FD147_1666 [Chloroflexota bacterium]